MSRWSDGRQRRFVDFFAQAIPAWLFGMRLYGNFVAQLDRVSLERVAIVSEINGRIKIEKRPDRAMEDL